MLNLAYGSVISFKPHFLVSLVPPGVVFLLSENHRFVIGDGPTAAVAALVDGRRTLAEIVSAAAPDLSELDVVVAVHELDAGGYLFLIDNEPGQTALRQRAFWHQLGLPSADTKLEAQVASVHVLGLPGDSPWASWMIEALRDAGVASRLEQDERAASADDEPPLSPALRVVITDDYRRSDLALQNRKALQDGVAWLLVKPTGTRAFIGPLLSGRKGGPCGECLANAIRRNRPVEQLIARWSHAGDLVSATTGELAAGVRTALGLAAITAAKYLAGAPHNDDLVGRLVELQLDSLDIVNHTVVARPQCPACGDPDLMRRRGEAPVELRTIAKLCVDDGGFRSCSPQETYEKYRHLVSPLVGAVTHLGPMPGRHGGLRSVYTSGYLVCPSDQVPRDNAFDKACAGKGRSEAQARASALCEALERASSVYQGDEARLRGTMRDIGATALHLNTLQNFSDRQYERRIELNRVAHDARRHVPMPFDPDTIIDWTPAWSITRNERRYLPLAYCFSEPPIDSGARFCRHNPNGTAAGNCLEEATLHGLLELLERDAAAIWWYNELVRPGVRLKAFGDTFFDQLITDYAKQGWTVSVLNIANDIGVSAFAAVGHHRANDRFTIGLGCHIDARLAIQRALTELNQIFDPEGRRPGPWDVAGLRSRDFLFPDLDAEPFEPDRWESSPEPDLRCDIARVVELLERHGLEVMIVNKSRPDFGLSVVQAIVPGLRHFWPRFAPGRLYTVPYEMGWAQRPSTEDTVNPVDLFL